MSNYKILGIIGSHRKEQKNTYYLVEKVLKVAGKGDEFETEIITLGDKNLQYCNSCFSCNHGPCPIEDDMQKIYPKLIEADAIILGSPVYIYNVSARMKTFIDRSRAVLFRKDVSLKGKIGAGVIVGFVRNAGSESTANALRNFFEVHQMFYAGTVIGNSGRKGGVTTDDVGKMFARQIGKRIRELLVQLKDFLVVHDKDVIDKIHSKIYD
ncbi:MAG: flavodoxin family protein [Candidatus Helarchaeota archaeon]